jgi:hypothetical protein
MKPQDLKEVAVESYSRQIAICEEIEKALRGLGLTVQSVCPGGSFSQYVIRVSVPIGCGDFQPVAARRDQG